MPRSTESNNDPLVKINTSAAENWCAFYAIANCLKYKDKSQRSWANSIIGLEDKAVLNGHFEYLKSFFDEQQKWTEECSSEEYKVILTKKITDLDVIIKALGNEGQESTLSLASSKRDQYYRDLDQPIKFENLVAPSLA